ncbi:NUDIX hydrolase [Sulfuricurvum sp.]|uniref:NUDIX domain-containing protein n=1 Tax=Sulfuricurvum sp. TaxID=2025608 RepID=UPI002614DB61|nr:NUDIX hydrolase [Sulfuricurvum sp.]MDD2837346.1 NUDIX hydrolase [Sulfuricurvum sp.]MDD3596361.1 NUDIX hydrolase [Sulfuricurvum sp.]
MITDVVTLPCEESQYVKPKRIRYLQEGTEKFWDMVEVHDSVAVILYHRERRSLVLVKQFRPPVYLKNGDGYTYELCAGIVDKAKSLIEIAREEVFEECGFDVPAEQIERVSSFYTSVGFAGSVQTLYYAEIDESMHRHSGGGVDVESIEVIEIPLEEAERFMMDESKAKTPGLMFGFGWFLKHRC